MIVSKEWMLSKKKMKGFSSCNQCNLCFRHCNCKNDCAECEEQKEMGEIDNKDY
ncbi:MAG: hypothetical protein MRERC_1c159 [Mycoplasmataceae bacterium RC_NB112A]|nr:MAG: hypothetical protein MRERC_1c159 [Mycoplasmataceae bacterium RC_NB112A]